eukprot:symbB.v1.2.012837.t1/scaffold887.1/size155094/4
MAADPHVTDLTAFHGYAQFQDWSTFGTFTRVRGLAEAIHGKVILYRWTLPNGEEQNVVVKRMPRDKVHQNEGRWANEMLAHRNPRAPQAPHMEDVLFGDPWSLLKCFGSLEILRTHSPKLVCSHI